VPNAKLANLGSDVRNGRSNKTLREAAREIGVSPATLMRVESVGYLTLKPSENFVNG